MKAVKAKINGTILKWAREQINVSVEDVASALKKKTVDKETILAWEEGNDFPTVNDAKKLAKLFGLNLAIFYLPKAPIKIRPIKDFRAKVGDLSRSFVYLMREVQNKQEWLEEYLKSEGADELEFVGKLNTDMPIKKAANLVRKFFDFDFENDFKHNNSYEDILKKRIKILEASGIFVFQASGINPHYIVDHEEVRGFTIASRIAPVIYINSKDYPSAKLFTLFHELIHIFLNESVISDTSLKNKNNVEVFCNKVAAELLLPEKKVVGNWQSIASVQTIAKKFNVSSIVVLIRAFNLGFVQEKEFETLRKKYRVEAQEYRAKKDKKAKESKGGPNYYLIRAIFNGKKFSQAVLDAYQNSRIVVSDIPYLLNIKTNKINDYIEAGKIYS